MGGGTYQRVGQLAMPILGTNQRSHVEQQCVLALEAHPSTHEPPLYDALDLLVGFQAGH